LNERFSFGASLALAALAGIGAQILMTRARERMPSVVFAAVLITLTVATVLILRAGIVGPNYERHGDYKIAADIGCLAVATLLLVTRLPRATLIPLFLGLILLQRTASDLGTYPIYPNSAAYPRVALFDSLGRDKLFRTIGIGSELMPGTSAFYELEDVRGYQAMTNLRYWETFPLWCRYVPVYFNHVDDLTKPFLSFLNVRFAVVPATYPDPQGWRSVSANRGAKLIENSRVVDRAFVPRTVRVGVPPDVTLMEMAGEKDFSARAWIRASLENGERANGPGHVTVRAIANGYLLDADMLGDGWIVVSTVDWPGWRAYIDGRRVKTHTANHAFVSVYVPKGRHEVRVVYLPQSFVVGRAITFAMLAMLVIAMLFWKRSVRPRP
jgi:hypothetical protein